jgi:rubrerythrin
MRFWFGEVKHPKTSKKVWVRVSRRGQLNAHDRKKFKATSVRKWFEVTAETRAQATKKLGQGKATTLTKAPPKAAGKRTKAKKKAAKKKAKGAAAPKAKPPAAAPSANKGGVARHGDNWVWKCPKCGTASDPIAGRQAARDAYAAHRKTHAASIGVTAG